MSYTPEQLNEAAHEVERGCRRMADDESASLLRAHAAALETIAMLRDGDTCARHCEGTAYRIEWRRSKKELDAALESIREKDAEIARLRGHCEAMARYLKHGNDMAVRKALLVAYRRDEEGRDE